MTKTRILLSFIAGLATTTASAQPSVAGCSNAENQVLARYVPPMTQAFLNGNLQLYKALADEANAKLSPACQDAIMQQQQRQRQQQTPQRARRPGGGSGINDHGGGAYSNSDVYCGPGGCVPLR